MKPSAIPTGSPYSSPFTGVTELPPGTADSSVSSLIKRLIAQTGELVRAEANVIKMEMQQSTRSMIFDGIKAAIYSGIAFLGILSLVAFMVIALGDLLTGGEHGVRGFWLSALIIGTVLSGGGGFMAYRHITQFGKDIQLPHTKRALRTDKQFIKEEMEKIKEASLP